MRPSTFVRGMRVFSDKTGDCCPLATPLKMNRLNRSSVAIQFLIRSPHRVSLDLRLSRNFLLGSENRAIEYPSRLFAYSKASFIGSTPDGLPSPPGQHKIAPFVAYFRNPSPYPNPAVDRFRCCLGHQLYPVRSGSTAMRPTIAPNRRRFRCPSASRSQ